MLCRTYCDSLCREASSTASNRHALDFCSISRTHTQRDLAVGLFLQHALSQPQLGFYRTLAVNITAQMHPAKRWVGLPNAEFVEVLGRFEVSNDDDTSIVYWSQTHSNALCSSELWGDVSPPGKFYVVVTPQHSNHLACSFSSNYAVLLKILCSVRD